MKIDRTRPSHWLFLAVTGVHALLALALRLVWRPRPGRRPLVVLYGHKLNGNLLALYNRMTAEEADAWRPVFLTLDPAYHRQLRANGVHSVLALHPRAIWTLARAAAMVTDHGLHSLQPLLGRAGLKCFDVWHGIPFKGFDANDFRIQHRYDETWVASPLLAKLYVERFGFRPEQVVATGYARTDRLVAQTENVSDLRGRLGLPVDRPVVLFAPTWAQDDAGRSIFPFNTPPDEFLAAVSQLACRCGATVVLRTHLNSGEQEIATPPGVIVIPTSREPDTEAILLASDVLVCDWSSIAFDFLLLDRPAVFLDVPAPFRKGFSLGPDYRYGAIAEDLGAALHWIQVSLLDPLAYWCRHRAGYSEVTRAVYGDCADEKATARCLQRLRLHIKPLGSPSN